MNPPPLNKLQRWMQSVITHPAGVEAGLSAPAAQAHLNLVPDQIEQIVEPSIRQSSIDRLAIYAGAYHARLIECLQAEFPVFSRTVGDDLFADFTFTYLQSHPSRSYTLGQLGAEFVQFLRETKPASNSAGNPPSPDWIDFLIDLAYLERTISEVFDAPGLEKNPAFTSDSLSSIDTQHWPHSRLTLAPCVRLLALQFPLHDYYTAQKKNLDVSIPARENSWLAITRRDYIVRRYQLSHPQFALLQAFHCGQTVGEAITAAAEIYPGDVDQLAVELRTWFSQWAAAPMFAQLQPTPATHN